MKILIIPAAPELFFVHRGYLLAKQLVLLGDEVHFIIWDPYPYPTDICKIMQNLSSSLRYISFVRDGVTVHKIRRLSFFFPLINRYMFRKLVSQICKREHLDVIVSESCINEVQPPSDLPLVYDLIDHNEAFGDIHLSGVNRFAYKYILQVKDTIHTQIKHAAAVTAVSNILVDYAKNINPNVPVYKIPNGVDPLFLEAPLERPPNMLGKYSMVYVSQFGEWANLPKIIEATSLLRRSHPDISLVLVGDGPAVPEAKQLVRKLGLSGSVTFLGWVEREEVLNIVGESAIALSPCKKDLYRDSAFPLKILEYTALGKKIVSSNLEEVGLLNFPNIILYDESKGVQELANGIITAFNTDIDQCEIRKLAFKYTWKDAANQFRGVIQKAIIAQRKG